MYQGGKPGTGKSYTDVCLCGSAHTSGCVVDGLGAIIILYGGASSSYYYHCIDYRKMPVLLCSDVLKLTMFS